MVKTQEHYRCREKAIMGTGKKKIEIKKKEKESDRMVTFSKRKQGLFRKASQLNALTGSDVAILVFSPAGRPHTNAPFFDLAISRYCSAVRATGDATTAAEHDGNDASVGSSTGLMWLDSTDGGASTSDHANGGSDGIRLNSVEPFVVVGVGDGGGEDIDDCSMSGNFHCIREWLNSIEVEGIESIQDLLVMKQRLENIKEKVMKKVDDAICSSFFV